MKERRYNIDWLRVIAMLSIFIYHCTLFLDTEGWRRWWQGLLARRCGCWMAGQFVLRGWGRGLAVGGGRSWIVSAAQHPLQPTGLAGSIQVVSLSSPWGVESSLSVINRPAAELFRYVGKG